MSHRVDAAPVASGEEGEGETRTTATRAPPDSGTKGAPELCAAAAGTAINTCTVKAEGKEQLPKQRPTSVVAGGYRADIDGMRTIAIIGVLLFHIDHHWMPGGFVGVDIFFVISGYVVAGSMLRHKRPAGCGGACENTVAFYSRRIKRLTPSLVLVAFASGALVAMFVPPTAHGSDSQQLLSGMLGLVGGANIQFAVGGGVGTKGVDGGYFAAQADTEVTPGSTLDWNAFTHNWSLGVEEQYYVLFPIILLAAEHANKIVLIGLLLSAALASWMTPAHPVLAFFLMPVRFWELAIGALLCALHLGKLGRRLTALNEFLLSQPLVIGALDITAIVTIILAYWLTEEKMGFPFPWALLSVFGAVCATSAGAVAPRRYFRGLWPMPLFNFVLRQPAMVYVGKLSYPLYLWHWPLMTTLRWLGMWGGWQGLVAVAVALVLSVFTYHCVEGWFRTWKPKRKWHIFALLLPMLAAAELWLGLLGGPLRGKLYIGNHQRPICRALPVPSSYSHAGLAFDCTCRAGSSLHLPPDATPFVLPTVSAAQPGTLQTAPQSEAPCLSDSAIAESTKMGDSGVDSTYCWRSGGLEEGDNTNIAACLGRGACSSLDAGLSSANVSRPGVFLIGDSHVGNYLVPFRMALNGVATFSSYGSLCGYVEPSFTVGFAETLAREGGIEVPITLTGCIQRIAAVEDVLTSANGIRPGDVLAVSAAAYKFTDDPQGVAVATHVAFLNRTISLVRARGGKLLLLGSVPVLNGKPPKSAGCTTDNLLAGVGTNGRAAFAYCDVNRTVAEARYAPFRAAMRGMADAAADVFFFDPFDLFFGNESATGYVPGTQMFAYMDHDHLDENMGGFYLWPFLCSFFRSSGILG